MPTIYPAEVNYRHFDWIRAAAEIDDGLRQHHDEILRVIGFNDEYGEQDDRDRSDAAGIEGHRILNEIAGILLWSASITLDAGFKAPNRVRATVLAVARDPGLLIRRPDGIEPEAIGSIAIQYQRQFERRGLNWGDVTGDSGVTPSSEQVKAAAEAAARQLSSEAKRGGRRDEGLGKLAELGDVFGRFQQGPISRAVASINSILRDPGTEYGRYIRFLELVLPPLDAVLRQYQPDRRPISRNSLIKRTMAWQRLRGGGPKRRGRPRATA